MRHIVLSDHVSELINAEKAQRQNEFDRAATIYEDRLNAREGKREKLKAASVLAFREGRYLAWIRTWLSRLVYAISPLPQKPAMREAGADRRKMESGREGERRVTKALAEQLSDEWILVDGYRNAKGEIDKLLVGPKGIVAIEVKYMKGNVSCDGDDWWMDVYDNYGNLKEIHKPIADKKGRGPSRQVNEAADLLEYFLKKKQPVKRIARGIVFSHDSAEIELLEGCTVDFATTLVDLDATAVIEKLPKIPFDVDPDRMAELVKRDNEYYLRRDKGPGRQEGAMRKTVVRCRQ